MEHAERAAEARDVIVAGGSPAGLMTAALLDAAGVRAEAGERGSEPARQSRGTAMHPRTLEVLTMIDAGDGRPISDVPLTQRQWVPDAHRTGLPGLPGCRGPDTPFPFPLTLPQWGTEHAPAGYLDAPGVRERHAAQVTTAGRSADEPRVQASGAWHTTRYLIGTDGAHSMVRRAAGTGFGAHSPSWLARTSNTGRGDAASLAWNWPATRTGRPDSHATHSVTVIPAVN